VKVVGAKERVSGMSSSLKAIWEALLSVVPEISVVVCKQKLGYNALMLLSNNGVRVPLRQLFALANVKSRLRTSLHSL
jgi:hypothetical protein